MLKELQFYPRCRHSNFKQSPRYVGNTAIMKEEDNLFDQAMKEWVEEEERYLRELNESTPQSREKWNTDDWVDGIRCFPGLIECRDCPCDNFSAEQWKDIITCGCGIEAQYCHCRNEVLALLTKEDFEFMGSSIMCTTIVLDGDWLAHLMPLEKIEQEDFDDLFVCDPDELTCKEDVDKYIAAYFPDNKIPEHLNWPFKEDNSQK